MQQKLALHFENLSQELMLIMDEGGLDEAKVEEGFTCSTRYWVLVKETVLSMDFRDEEEEIRFFKYEKPRFTGMIEYFILLYQAYLFMPKVPGSQSGFWQREMRRTDKFYTEHSSFYAYYFSGATFKDHTWFMRAFEDEGMMGKDRIYCQDPSTTAPMDWLVAMVEAFGRYRKFVQDMC